MWRNGKGPSWQTDLNQGLDALAATGLPIVIGEFGPVVENSVYGLKALSKPASIFESAMLLMGRHRSHHDLRRSGHPPFRDRMSARLENPTHPMCA
jgi:hypothetical protein